MGKILKSKEKSFLADAQGYLKRFFAEFPDLTVAQETPTSQDAIQPDIQFRLRRGDQEATLQVATRASAEPRIAANWIDRLPRQRGRSRRHYPILCAPYISSATGEMLRSRRIGYIDLSGNCWLDLGFLFVERSGRPNRFKVAKEQHTLFAPKAAKILRIVLENPAKGWTLHALAQTAGVSLGLVHRVTEALEEGLFAEKQRGRFTLEEPGALLDAWRSFYVGQRIRWQRYYCSFGQDLRAGMDEVARCTTPAGVRYAFTGPAAASLVVPYLMVSVIHCYLHALQPGLLDLLKADPIPSGGNLWLSVTHKEDIFAGSRKIQDLYVVSDIQMYLDLHALGGRGREAAETLRERRLRF